MRWGDYIKRTAVRRLVWIVVGLLVYAVLAVVGVAKAQEYANPCAPGTSSCNVEEAYQACMGAIAWAEAGGDTIWLPGSGSCVVASGTPERAQGQWWARGKRTNGNNYSLPESTSAWSSNCPGGTEWRDDLKRCAESCNALGPLSGTQRWTTSGSAYAAPCVNGCTYEGEDVCAGDWCIGRNMQPTGQQCTTGPTPNAIGSTPDGVCSPIGNRGAQHCVSTGNPPNHCIVHANGLSQCWTGAETGPRVDRSGHSGAGRDEVPNEPQPHPNQQGAQEEGRSTAAAGGKEFIVVEFSGSGNGADQGDNGSAPGEGSAPGWGNTIGQGPGNSDGTGEGEDGEGPGTPSPGISDDLYERDGRTLEQLYDEYRARVDNAPIVQALDGIFSPPQGGSCPTFSLPASAYWEAMVFDFHCREPLSDILALMGWVVLALAAYLAVRIAFE